MPVFIQFSKPVAAKADSSSLLLPAYSRIIDCSEPDVQAAKQQRNHTHASMQQSCDSYAA